MNQKAMSQGALKLLDEVVQAAFDIAAIVNETDMSPTTRAHLEKLRDATLKTRDELREIARKHENTNQHGRSKSFLIIRSFAAKVHIRLHGSDQ